jgi:iron complex outermembrane receptor protein
MALNIHKEFAMRMKETVVARSIRLMRSGGVAIGVGLTAQVAFAQAPAAAADTDASAAVQRVEVTGSSIKRIAKEGALPIQTLTAADIQKTGATNISDLLQKLPAMQGFVPAASTINGAGGQDGGGGGATTAALHAMASKYTLVLLDGQRIAPLQLGATQGGGYGTDIGSIPMDAIERVEVLTDGASSLYGSDAIAGVVNFITKKNSSGGDVFIKYDRPQHPGGRSLSTGFSKGIGDLSTDNYNFLFSYSHDSQDAVQASQRSASRDGSLFPFSYGGQNYNWVNRSGSTSPANLTFTTTPVGGTAKTTYTINPYYAANGSCGNPYADIRTLSPAVSACQFNSAALSEDEPATKRDSLLGKATFNLSPDTQLWAEGLLTRYSVTDEFAPAAANLSVTATGNNFATLYAKYITPYVTANNLAAPASVTMGYRSTPLGERSDDYIATTSHLAGGIDGQWNAWSYSATFALSHVVDQDRLAGGYGDLDALKALVAAGTYDPVTGAGASSLASTLLTGMIVSTTTSDVDSVHFGGQHDTFELPGGTSILSLGIDATRTRYVVNPNALEQDNSGYSTQSGSTDIAVGSQAAEIPFDASRNNLGVYGEWLLPLTKSLEVTLSDRFNKYGKVYSRDRFSVTPDTVTKLLDQMPDGSVGNSFSADTYKASFRWTPVESLLLRGGFGTGFKAPDLGDIANPVAYSAPTSSLYPCPFPGSVGCLSGPGQYSILKGGNSLSGSAGLKPERSQQWTLGFRVDPAKGISAGADLWSVQIKDQVLPTGVSEQTAFTNPQQYANLFINPYTTPTGAPGIGFMEVTTNGGIAHYRGVDWDVSLQTKTPFGDWSTSWTGTWMLKQDYTLSPGGAVQSDLGKFGSDLNVVFRTQMRILTSLQTGAFTNSLTANYKSGYHDEQFPAAGSPVYAGSDTGYTTPIAFPGLYVHPYVTFDGQSKYQATKALAITVGVKNLFDRVPPLSLQTAGGGNYSGYDGRYYDILGRTYYVGANYKF